MALFEKKHQNKINIDDTTALICTIENAHNINKHTEYKIKVQRGPSMDNTWQVSRRYKDFASLQGNLQCSDITLPLPPKKLIGNMQPTFIAERQIALQNYLIEILKHPILANALAVKRFLDPENYSSSFHETALQNVSMALRGEGGFELKGPLQNIGWRIRKHYFTVTSNVEPKEEYILSWQTYGPDKNMSDKDMAQAFKSIQSMSHPYIDKVVFIRNLEAGAYTVRHARPDGSIRDQLYGCQYKTHYLGKYGNPKTKNSFTSGQLAHYGLQILQALKFLNEKGFPYGHLHPGNVAIENHKVLLLDIENGLIGVPSVYRPYIVHQRKINNLEAVDVYCFGHTLYEMAFAEPLKQPNCDSYPSDVSPELESVLRLCLSSVACKRGLATLDELILHPFFSGRSSVTATTHLKFPLQLKEALKEAVGLLEERLKSDQKLVRNEKRQVRIQQILSSDEEMRKQRRKARRRDNTRSPESTEVGCSRSISVVSVASTMSTASSPTPPPPPPLNYETSLNSTSTSVTPSSPGAPDSRSALLGAICSFNKNKLQRVNGNA